MHQVLGIQCASHDCLIQVSELTGMNADHGIDPANKELYLADEEFQTSFEMDKDAFKASDHHFTSNMQLLMLPARHECGMPDQIWADAHPAGLAGEA